MRSRSVRRIALACIIPAATVAALAAPGAASAALVQCEGGNIHGKGSSAQNNVQTLVWGVQFNKSPNAKACNGTQGSGGKPTSSYLSTGSGVGLESWGVETEKGKKNNSKGFGAEEIRFGPENAFVGTEIAPNKKQREEVVAHGSGNVLTIPVLQAAVSIIFHLPKGCTSVTGGPVSGRIALKDTTLEKIFQGTVTKWSQVLNKAKLVGSEECEKKGKLEPIIRVVREDGSGTTDAFMKYLNVIYKKPVLGSETWNQLGETTKNTTWPNEAEHPVVRGNGGGGVVTKVAETVGGIGYANVSDSRKNAAFQPPIGATFWADVESNKVNEGGKTVPVYTDPATNGEIAEKGSANCKSTLYTNGTKKFPPPNTEELWNEVVAAKTQPSPNYADCYLSFDLALTKYSAFTKGTVKEELPFSEPPTEGETQTVKDYLGYELSTGAGGGQPGAEGEDYSGVPTSEEASQNVLLIAQQGVGKIGF